MRVNDFIVCDDIRTELGNKQSLMGLFGDEMTMAPMAAGPVMVRLAAYVNVQLDPTDRVPDRFSVAVRLGETELAAGNGVIVVKDRSRPIVLSLILNGIQMPGSGSLVFHVTLYDGATNVGERIEHKIQATILPAPAASTP